MSHVANEQTRIQRFGCVPIILAMPPSKCKREIIVQRRSVVAPSSLHRPHRSPRKRSRAAANRNRDELRARFDFAFLIALLPFGSITSSANPLLQRIRRAEQRAIRFTIHPIVDLLRR